MVTILFTTSKPELQTETTNFQITNLKQSQTTPQKRKTHYQTNLNSIEKMDSSKTVEMQMECKL